MVLKLSIAASFGVGIAMLAGSAFANPALVKAPLPLLDGPGADYRKLADLPAQAHVNVVWCGLHDQWCLIEEHNKLGWIPLASLETHLGHGGVVGDGSSSAPGSPGTPVASAPHESAPASSCAEDRVRIRLSAQ